MADGGEVNVLKGSRSMRVFDVSVALFINCVKAEEVAVDFVAAVSGGIVHYHYLVVGVVLREDGVEVGLDAKIGIVVVTRHYNAHREFLLYA